MTANYDIAVIGAGFAGLACARRAAQRGLSVVVLERKTEPGERIHTTGILVREAWEEWAAPSALVRRISRVRVYTPSHRFVELNG
ncbi:MAG: FAD-dependent oxidoreductase, partial [Gemmatimonadetes bacterium]|nr:FAD-dependent oxidoreductase [Gemmatimonadota bacterium]